MRIADEHEVVWRLKAVAPGAGRLVLRAGGRTIGKTVAVGGRPPDQGLGRWPRGARSSAGSSTRAKPPLPAGTAGPFGRDPLPGRGACRPSASDVHWLVAYLVLSDRLRLRPEGRLQGRDLRIPASKRMPMKIDIFKMERMQSTWENVVDYNLSESGVHPLTLKELLTPGRARRARPGSSSATPRPTARSGSASAIAAPLPGRRPGADPGHGRLVGGQFPAHVEPHRARRRGPLRAARTTCRWAGSCGPSAAEVKPFSLREEPGLAARPRRAARGW
ncbi:MAG: hypothetical protein M0C28_27950 [Candidatus Moduliflexus flocculans]|nr:hypothetical protein [Candidatus Moduliflexus flocculans]